MLQRTTTVLFEDFNFLPHFAARYAANGYPFQQYEFAYRYGYELAAFLRFEDKGWLVVETHARREWKERYPFRDWLEYRDAVRCAWQMVKRSIERTASERFMSLTERMRSWTVLLVDDEPDNLGVALQILEFYGARIYTACDGEQALAIMRNTRPTFVLTDLSMPVLDGWQFLNEIRRRPEWCGIPVIALTAHAMRGDREKALAQGFDQYISKPFRLTTFVSDLESCITRMTVAVA
jgi:two-component system, cell cycle response regulator DivK